MIGKGNTMVNIIVLATNNKNKVRELKELLAGSPVDIKSLAEYGPLPSVVEDGDTFEENAYKKAYHYARVLGLPCLADDSGLVVDALDGKPGVHSARYAGENATDLEKCDKLLREMKGKENRKAHFACVLSLATPGGPALTWEGSCEGEITTERHGESGFGYDPVFYYPEFGKTFAEVSMEEKNRVSHRGRAFAQFAEELDKVMIWLRHRLLEQKPPKPDHKQFEHNDWSEDKMV